MQCSHRDPRLHVPQRRSIRRRALHISVHYSQHSSYEIVRYGVLKSCRGIVTSWRHNSALLPTRAFDGLYRRVLTSYLLLEL